MKICFIPIDNRPVCYSLPQDIVAIDECLEIFIPPRELLGDLTKPANVSELFKWLKEVPQCDAIVLSLDTIAYGGLISSRRSSETYEEIKSRVFELRDILLEKKAKVYAFSSIMRISNNNYNEEEKEYWKDYGKKIFEYSFSGGVNKSDIPQDILEDYLTTRKRNFEINKLYLHLQKEALFETLIFSKDDCAEYGFNVEEAKELEKLGGRTKTGADEIPLSLLARAINKNIKVYVEFTESEHVDLVSNYEDISIKQSVLGQLELCGFHNVEKEELADVILIVNNFKEKQGELVMGWDTEGKYEGPFVAPSKKYCVADVRFANGADNCFVNHLLDKIELDNFYGYAGWNTSANTLGTILATLKVKYDAKKYNDSAFKKLQMIRFLDDWAYQANVRAKIDKPCDVSIMMKPFEEKLSKKLCFEIDSCVKYIYPWNRKFEVEVLLK